MTTKERLIVSAYTGVLMCDFDLFHRYIEHILKRPVYTHELAYKTVQEEIKEKSRKSFLALCAGR